MRNLGGRQSSKFARHCGTKVQSRRLGSVLRSSRRTRSSRWSEMAALRSAWLGQPRAAGETDGSTMEWSNECCWATEHGGGMLCIGESIARNVVVRIHAAACAIVTNHVELPMSTLGPQPGG